MPSTKNVKKLYIIGILAIFILLAVSLSIFPFGKKSSETVSICNSKFHFEEFYQIDSSHNQTKIVADHFLSKIVSLNGVDGVNGFCASAITGKESCIQYFQPQASAGGDVRICVNRKRETLLLAEFGE